MGIPDFDYELESDGVDVSKVAFDERDDKVADKLKTAVSLALSARQALTDAAAEAIETSSTFGYELGVIDERQRIVDLMKPALCDEKNCEKEVCKQYLAVYRKVESGEK